MWLTLNSLIYMFIIVYVVSPIIYIYIVRGIERDIEGMIETEN